MSSSELMIFSLSLHAPPRLRHMATQYTHFFLCAANNQHNQRRHAYVVNNKQTSPKLSSDAAGATWPLFTANCLKFTFETIFLKEAGRDHKQTLGHSSAPAELLSSPPAQERRKILGAHCRKYRHIVLFSLDEQELYYCTLSGNRTKNRRF